MRRSFQLEVVCYSVIFLTALFIRLAGIQHLPLADSEAILALQALALSKGEPTQAGPQPAYLALTTAWMFLFGSADWVARFWPALSGSLLVLTPLLFRRWLGRQPAVFAALFLALDPGLLATSLQAGGQAISLLMALLAFGLALNRRMALAGAAAGLALASGPAVWPGVLGLGLAAWLAFRRPGAPAGEPEDQPAQPPLILGFEMPAWRKMALSALAALFLGATLFFSFPRGLSAVAGSLAAYLRGWGEPSGISLWMLVLALVLYEFLPLFLGLWGGAGGALRKNPLDRFLLIWWLIAAALALIYPGRQVSDLAWAVVPLTGLAGRQLVRMLDLPKYDRLAIFGQTMLFALILGFISLTALSMVNNPQFVDQQEYWARLAGAVIILLASTGLIGWGWSKVVAVRGSTWGIFAVLLVYAVSAAWNTSNLAPARGYEFWSPERRPPAQPLLLSTIADLANWGPVVSGGPDLVVEDIQSPALRWALRGRQKISYVSRLPAGVSPALVITADRPDLALASTYRGQDFVLNQIVDWQSFKPNEWLRWMAFRTVPDGAVQQDRLVLWARTDLFPGGGSVLLDLDPLDQPDDPQ